MYVSSNSSGASVVQQRHIQADAVAAATLVAVVA